MKETERLSADPVPGITAAPKEDNLRYFDVKLEGQADTPYHGGTFRLELFLPDGYPMCPPKVRFLTKVSASTTAPHTCYPGGRLRWQPPHTPGPALSTFLSWLPAHTPSHIFSLSLSFSFSLPRPQIYHPNIDKVGRICLDILKDKWSPALQIRHVLLSIHGLMSSPAPEDPLANDVAEVYKANPEQFFQNARDWTKQYAK